MVEALKYIKDLDKWQPLVGLKNRDIGDILFLWPPSPCVEHSMFKHFTYFGETVEVMSRLGFPISALDCGTKLYARSNIFSRFRKTKYLIMPLELYNARIGLSLARIYKDLRVDGKVIVYGTAASLIPNYLIRNTAVDFVVPHGNFLLSIISAINYAETGIELKDMGQILTKIGGTKKKFGTPYGCLDSNLWGNPLNANVPLEEYYKFNNGMLEFTVQVGCPWNCTFCSEKILFRTPTTTYRSIEKVVDIISHAQESSWKGAYLSATTFTFDREYVLKLCDAIIKRGIKLNLRTDTRIDSVDEELLSKMAEAGFKKISFGVETFQNDIQISIKKPIDLNKIEQVFKTCRAVGIAPRALLMMGLKGQKAEEIRDSVRILKSWGGEVRIKEYYPIGDILEKDMKSPEEVEKYLGRFERLDYRADSIPRMSRNEYMEYLFPEDFIR
jgi:radical SAM superfamily enzyme YgiQ (UPF0313 family)